MAAGLPSSEVHDIALPVEDDEISDDGMAFVEDENSDEEEFGS